MVFPLFHFVVIISCSQWSLIRLLYDKIPPVWTLVFYAMCHYLMLDSTVFYLFFIRLRNLGLTSLSIVHNKGCDQIKGTNIFQIIWKKRRNIFSLLSLTNVPLLTEECNAILSSHNFLRLEVWYFDYQTFFLSFLVFFAMFILWHRVFLVLPTSGYYSIIRVQLMRLVKSYCFPKLPTSKYHHFLGDVLLVIIEILFFFSKYLLKKMENKKLVFSNFKWGHASESLETNS